jgi:hypothetical protein
MIWPDLFELKNRGLRMIELRDAQLPADANAILQLDTSFSTHAIYVVDQSPTGILLREIELAQPLTKRFPLDDLKDENRSWDFAQLAVDGGRVCGFAAAAYQEWNRRLIVSHLYVDGPDRNRGIASRSMACGEARSICGLKPAI